MKKSIYTILFFFITAFGVQAQTNCETDLSLSPPVPGNIYCPDDNVTLITTPGYNEYTWYYNFTNSNTGGTVFSNGADNQVGISVSDWGFAYFYVEAVNDTCEAVSDPVLMDSWLFLLPVIQSSGQPEYCKGDSSLILYPSGGAASYQWFKDGQPIPGANQQEYWVKETGTYTLTVSYIECPNFFQSSGVGPSFTFIEPEIPDILENSGVLSVSSGEVLQWYNDGEPIEGANDPTYSPEYPGGIYTAEVVDANGCIGITDAYKVFFVSTTEMELLPKLEVMPNPSSGWFQIQSDQSIQQMSVFDSKGQEVLKLKVNQSTYELDLSRQSSGVYYIRCNYKDGQSLSQTILIQR